MTSEQLSNAQIIINVAGQVGANSQQLLAAIEAALVESSLRNLNYGDRDSIGLFQQRSSQGWGSRDQILDPYYSAQAFFLGAGSNKGVLTVNQSGSAGAIAQRVQRSAYPSRYDAQETTALLILTQLGAAAQATVDNRQLAGTDTIDATTADAIGAGTIILIGAGLLVAYLLLSD